MVYPLLAAGYNIIEKDPFVTEIKIQFANKIVSPYVYRIHVLWQEMRKQVIERFPKSPTAKDGVKLDVNNYLADITVKYVEDAYNSLSIEGYQVSSDLIEKVRSGKWNPGNAEIDNEHKNALAARGYWQAFQSVKASVQKVLSSNPKNSSVDGVKNE